MSIRNLTDFDIILILSSLFLSFFLILVYLIANLVRILRDIGQQSISMSRQFQGLEARLKNIETAVLLVIPGMLDSRHQFLRLSLKKLSEIIKMKFMASL